MLTRRNSYLIAAAVVLLSGVLISLGLAGGRGETPNEVLGEAQIVVYAEGKKTTLDPQSPCFSELQATCEDVLTSGEFFGLKAVPDPEEVKSRNWAIELTYSKPISVNIGLGSGRNIEVFQLLIPLTGEWTEILVEDATYTYLFPFPEKINSPGQISDYWSNPIGTKKGTQGIKDLLTEFNRKGES